MRIIGSCGKLGLVAVLALATALTGCVAYPYGGYYGGYAPAYYPGPSYAVIAPPVVGYWGGGYGHRWR